MIEKSCFNCAFGGCKIEKENLFKCDNKNIDGKKTFDTINKEWLLGDRGNECEEFIPDIEIENEDIECYTVMDIHYKCPYCDYEGTIYDVSNYDSKIIECDKCGKKYKINWSVE